MSKNNISYNFAKTHGVVQLDEENPVALGVRSGANLESILEARRVLRSSIKIVNLSTVGFDKALSEQYASAGLENSAAEVLTGHDDLASLAEGIPITEDLLDSEDDAPVIRLINGMMQEAIRLNASDIHVEPHENRLSIRFRVDGRLREILSLGAQLSGVLVSRIKVMARLDIAKKRIPQDGRFSLNLGRQAIDVRVSTLPSRFGERAVLRLLVKENALFSVEELGMTNSMKSRFEAALSVPNGIILVSGPTGSGKTTTLYAGLTHLNQSDRNILTVEDPVEYALDGIGQTQVDNKVGMTFAKGLRAILRQDPDVVMVGEIRDKETAEIAVQASLTGHLVLSTVHTNSAIAAITRLRDMGIERFLLASTVTAIIAQRLVRKLCDDCKVSYDPVPSELARLGIDQAIPLYQAHGCEKCQGSGFKGRIGIYEMVSMDDHLRELIHDGERESALSAYAFAHTDTLLKSGARLVKQGVTSASEVLRVCKTDGLDDAGV